MIPDRRNGWVDGKTTVSPHWSVAAVALLILYSLVVLLVEIVGSR